MELETAAALAAALNSDNVASGWAPSLVARLDGPDGVARVRADLNRRIGSPVSIGTVKGEQSLIGPAGRVAAWAESDAEGRLSGLMIAPAGVPSALRYGRIRRQAWIGLAGMAAFTVLAGVSAWTATTVGSELGGVLRLVAFSALATWLVGWWFFPRWVGRVGLAVVPAGASSLVRLPALAPGSGGDLAVSGAFLAAVVGYLAWARCRPVGPRVREPLRLPVLEGRWLIVQGGRGLLNQHRRAPEQVGALDLVRIDSNGSARAGGTRDLATFAAYGSSVVSPCAGTVVAARDGLPDQQPDRPQLAPVAGNHVRIDTGSEEILLAHLQSGSVRVRAGDRVVRGQPIGRVGNSGNTTEPHLHLHAERAGAGLQLRFEAVRGPLARRAILQARGSH